MLLSGLRGCIGSLYYYSTAAFVAENKVSLEEPSFQVELDAAVNKELDMKPSESNSANEDIIEEKTIGDKDEPSALSDGDDSKFV